MHCILLAELTLAELKDIQLPDTMKRAMARQAEAEREKRAKIINAEGKSLAAAALGDASDTMKAHPLALQLRNLQSLVEIGVDKNTTVVFPAPLMSTIGELGSFLARETAAATSPALPAELTKKIPGPTPTRRAQDRVTADRRTLRSPIGAEAERNMSNSTSNPERNHPLSAPSGRCAGLVRRAPSFVFPGDSSMSGVTIWAGQGSTTSVAWRTRTASQSGNTGPGRKRNAGWAAAPKTPRPAPAHIRESTGRVPPRAVVAWTPGCRAAGPTARA
ncbi:hypothetical protein AB0M61_19930 [Streptomyces sp. NPDC051642]|uniref:hypothetical protein n=1 Tax=Streptomyces sp. NPDC051642 TaxID=3154646 RepID=UPI00341359BC